MLAGDAGLPPEAVGLRRGFGPAVVGLTGNLPLLAVLVELGVLVTVFGVMVSVFYLFAGRGRREG